MNSAPESVQETEHSGPAVCHLLNRVNMGGAENLVVHLSSLHAKRGYPSHVIVMHGPGPLSPRFDEKVHLHYLYYGRESIRNPFRFVVSIVKGYTKLSGVLRREGIDVLQTHMQDTNLWGFILQLTGKCRTVFTVHSNRFINYDSGTRLGKWITYSAYRAMVRSRGAMVAVSSRVKASIVEQLGLSESAAADVAYVDNGVPMPDPLPESERAGLRAQYGVSNRETWVVAAGRFAEPKNFGCLLRCAAWLKEQAFPVKVLIAGEGPLRDELLALADELELGEMVVMPGNLDNLRQVMAAADIFAIPSLWEGLPLVLVEAMAAGLPVVGSNAKGIADIVTHGENGLLSEVSDHEALGRSIIELAEDPEKRRSLGNAGADLARRNFSIETVHDKYLRIYERLTPSNSD